ncbi:MAG: threonine-phosphate decarboxylase CobD [Rhizobiaceae bacterium]
MALKPIRNGRLTGAHGGDLDAARILFPNAPEPWIDLSTGVNPHSYPDLAVPYKAQKQLPPPVKLELLRNSAAAAYRLSDPSAVVVSAGTQPVLAAIMRMIEPGGAAILGPTYSEHARSAALAGHQVEETGKIENLADADIAVVVNPNNPDGRLTERNGLLELAGALRQRSGILLVDEAFMDVAPDGYSVADDFTTTNIVVLKSFGKFFGLAGIRLSFAIAPADIAAYLAAVMGPWPVSATALETGIAALNDAKWRTVMRERLQDDGDRLASLLRSVELKIAGGTNLFQLVNHDNAPQLFEHLGNSGIFVRHFPDRPHYLRLGLPASEEAWSRLSNALLGWKG